MFVGVWLTLIGSDQVWPPSVDIEKAIPSALYLLLKRASAQTAYRLPLFGSTAAERIGSPARTGAPVSGSVTSTVSIAGPSMMADQVAPWSVERRTPSTLLSACAAWLPEPEACVK